MASAIRILVVDDDEDIAKGTCRVLKQAGYGADMVITGTEALAAVRVERPDMLLLDRSLPDMDGIDVCRMIKHDPELAHIFVVIISGVYINSEEQVECLEAGADGYIVRPIQNRELIARVEAFVRILRLTAELKEKAHTLEASNAELIESRAAILRLAGEAVAQRMKSENALTALESSEFKYRHLYESMMDAVATTDMEGRIQDSNTAFQVLLGYSDEELRQMSAYDITPRQWHAMETQIFKDQVLREGHSEIYEKEYQRRDGSILPVELRTFLLRDGAGQPSGMWAIVRDITERKAALQAMHASEERHRLLVQHLAAGVVVHAPDGKILLANTQVCALLGVQIDLDDAAGVNPTWSFVCEDETPMLQAEYPLNRVLASLAPVRDIIVGINRPAGDRVWALVNAFPEFYGGDVLQQVVVTFVDITSRILARKEMKESEEKFRKAFMTGLDALYIST